MNKTTELAMTLARSALQEQAERIKELEDALRDLLATPAAAQALRYLDSGIGTATTNAVWLRARSVLNKETPRG